MLRQLTRLASPERILVIGTYRDVDLDRAHPLTDALSAWPREAGYEHLSLEGLDGEATTALLAAMAEHKVELRVGAAWVRETGGNPFFVQELVRHLMEEGKLFRDSDGRWTTTAPLRELALPVAARDVVIRRLSRLPQETTSLLTVGAAFEGAFRFDVVAGIAGLSEEKGLDALEAAVAARIVEPSGDSESYAFTHALVRHALYDGLVPSRRSRLHRRVAEALEAEGGRLASAAEIAVHYHRSVALAGAERGVEPALEAAAAAQGTGAYDEAATFLRMALGMLPAGDARRPRLRGRLAIVLAWALAFDEAVEIAGQAGDAIAEAEGKQAAAEYLSDAAYVCALAGGIVPSWDLARHGLPYAGARDVAWARLLSFDLQRREAEANEGHRGIPLDSAERREAAAILRAAKLDPLGPAPMEAVFDSREDAGKTSNLVILSLWAGEYAATLPLFEAEGREAEALGRLARGARAWAGVACCHGALGQLDEARRFYGQAQDLAVRLGAPVPSLIYPQYLLASALDEGWEELAALFVALASSTHPTLAWTLGFANAGAAMATARLGRGDEALAAVERLVPWLERAPAWTLGFPVMACGAAEALWVLQRTDNLEPIERALRDKLLPSGFRYPMVDGRLALARLCAVGGRLDEALDRFAEARRSLDEEGVRPLRAVCDFDEAMTRLRRAGAGDAEAARSLLLGARRQFEELGMSGWLRRADHLAADLV
jgi:tetratricopeptide (TPR) repeat protein